MEAASDRLSPAVRMLASAIRAVGLAHWKVSVTGEYSVAGELGASCNGGHAEGVRPGISVVLAGGGTAGHVEPAMAVADALTALDPDVRITALGTPRGLETRLVPERGYHLELITPVPLPRKPSGDLMRLPLRVRRAVRQTRAVLDDVDADVVIGFGGYVALPAYLAARGGPRRRRRVPVVVHEANASAGWANRVGARSAQRVLSAVPDPGLRARRGRRGAGARRDHLAGPDGAAGRGAGTLRVRRRRTGAAGVRRLAGRAVGSTERSPRPPKTLPRRVSRCCTPTARRTPSICASPPTVTRRTSPCRIWTGWTWPTPPPTWRSAGPAR